LVTRRPSNGEHATPDVGHDAAPGRLVHLGAHHLYLVTDFWHECLLTTLVGHIPLTSILGLRNLDEISMLGTGSRSRAESSRLSGDPT
jgi:hypothetical protein